MLIADRIRAATRKSTKFVFMIISFF